jgi:hypothetical protein
VNLVVDWNQPMTIRLKSRQNLAHAVVLDNIASEAGTYILGRQWGRSFEALYVEKAINISNRLNGQLKI